MIEQFLYKRSIVHFLTYLTHFPYFILVCYVSGYLLNLFGLPAWIIVIPILIRTAFAFIAYNLIYLKDQTSDGSNVNIDIPSNIVDPKLIARLHSIRSQLHSIAKIGSPTITVLIFPEHGNLKWDPRHGQVCARDSRNSKTIQISERLAQDSSDDEILGIFSHELGHIQSKHSSNSILWAILTGCANWILVLTALISLSHFGFFTVLGTYILIKVVSGPIVNLPSRSGEKTADIYTSLLGLGSHLQSFLERNPHKLQKFPIFDYILGFTSTHPALRDRLRIIELNK